MIFSGVTFIYVFLPAVLLVYFVVPSKLKNAVLLTASLIFYRFGEPVFVWLLIVSSVSDWLHSLYIEKHRGTVKAKAALISSIIINLGMLSFFKYTDFILTTVNGLFGFSLLLTGIQLPIGISFFTFQTMSYTIDVYRGKVHAQKNPVSFATFVCLFPQLIAGPIVRYSDIDTELTARRSTIDGIAAGITRFAVGLGKKVLIANALGEICVVFRASDDKSVLFYWIYAFAFTLQIYFDFSGYSDMAIGLGRIFGFTFPENFNYPYISRSVTEFWRRWHITLGVWFRDYVYIPMGGNRTERKWKWLRNIAVVWLLTGIWHGAEWNFALWGVFYGVLLIAEKLWLGKYIARCGSLFSRLYVITAVVIGFVIFNAEGISGLLSDFKGMFGLGDLPAVSTSALYCLKSGALLFTAAIIGCTPLCKRIAQRVSAAGTGVAAMAAEPIAVIILLTVVTANLVDGSFNPFLYFRF